MSRLSAYARELEVLLDRSARRGWLDLDELVEIYTELRPGDHPELKNPRKVDIRAMAMALARMPPELVVADHVLLVPELDAFVHEPLPPALGMPAGMLGDGTILLETRLGRISLANLAAALCLIRHEVDKAATLLPPGDSLPDEEEHHLPEEATDRRPDETEEGITAATGELASGAQPETAAETETETDTETETETETDTDTDTDNTETETDAAASGETGADTPDATVEDPDTEVAPAFDFDRFSHTAFDLGTDPASLWQAHQATSGTLVPLLTGELELPTFALHADLDPQTRAGAMRQRAERIVGTLAEMGLAARPIHLWIGSDVITECVSPYGRELREVLRRWCLAHPDEVGEDISGLQENPGEDVIYAMAHDFRLSDPQLEEERQRADRTVGILRQQFDDVAFEVIDLARVDPNLIDARLLSWHLTTPAPVILRVSHDIADADATFLQSLLESLGPSVTGVSAVLDGTPLSGQAGGIVVPHLMVRWAGEEKLTLPTASNIKTAELHGYADELVHEGAVVSVPSAALISPTRMRTLGQRLNIAAVTVGNAGLVAAIADALWSGHLRPQTEVGWVVVGTQHTRTSRPSVQSLAGQSAIAIARLRKLTGPREAPPKAKQKPDRPRRAASARALRIKA